MAEKISSIVIFEVMGKPAEFIKEKLTGIIDKLGKEKGIKITSRKMQEPKQIEKSDMFTTFAEVELEAENITTFLILAFNYMPAHIEIINPTELKMKNFEMTSAFNEILTKLHGYDSIAKTLLFERNNLVNQLRQLSGQIAQSEDLTGNKTGKRVKPGKKKKRL